MSQPRLGLQTPGSEFGRESFCIRYEQYFIQAHSLLFEQFCYCPALGVLVHVCLLSSATLGVIVSSTGKMELTR